VSVVPSSEWAWISGPVGPGRRRIIAMPRRGVEAGQDGRPRTRRRDRSPTPLQDTSGLATPTRWGPEIVIPNHGNAPAPNQWDRSPLSPMLAPPGGFKLRVAVGSGVIAAGNRTGLPACSTATV